MASVLLVSFHGLVEPRGMMGMEPELVPSRSGQVAPRVQ